MTSPKTSISDLQKCGNKDCKMPIRPANTLVADYPGTNPRGAFGMCGNCYQKTRREAGKTKHRQAASVIEENRRNTEAFLQRIRETQQRKERQARVRMVIR